MPLEAVQVGPSISNNNNNSEKNPSQPQQCPTLAKATKANQAKRPSLTTNPLLNST